MGTVIHYQDFYDKLVMEYNNAKQLDEEDSEYLMSLLHKLEEWDNKDQDNRRKGLYSKKNQKREREDW